MVGVPARAQRPHPVRSGVKPPVVSSRSRKSAASPARGRGVSVRAGQHQLLLGLLDVQPYGELVLPVAELTEEHDRLPLVELEVGQQPGALR